VAERYAEVLDALPEAPVGGAGCQPALQPGLTREEIMAATGMRMWAVRRAIKKLVLAGVIETMGTGIAGDPHQHRKRADERSCGPAGP